jgi:hypothetical protein
MDAWFIVSESQLSFLSVDINLQKAEEACGTSTLYLLKCRKIAPGFGVPARRDFSSIAVAILLKSQRSWRVK